MYPKVLNRVVGIDPRPLYPTPKQGTKVLTCTRCSITITVEYEFPSYMQPSSWSRVDYEGRLQLDLCPNCTKEFVLWTNVDWLIKVYG